MTAIFNAADSEEIRQWLDRGFEKAAQRAIVSTAARLVSYIQNEVIPKEDPSPVDKGLFRGAWRFRGTPGGSEVWNTAPHAPMIEYGVRAENVKIGRAMIDALSSWVVRKGLAGPAEARGMAFAIANNMKKKGIFNRDGKKGLRILEKSVAKLGDFFAKEFKAEIDREM